MEETTYNQTSGQSTVQLAVSPTNQPTHAARPPLGPVSTALLRHRRGGQAVVMLALFMMLLLGLAGTVYDIGFARHEASRAQRAADASALAGVVFMPQSFRTSGTANAYQAAQLTGERHGYVDTQIFPMTVPNNGSQLKVDITSVYTTAFLGIFGFSTLPIHVSATAEYNTPIVMGAPEPYLGVGSPLAVQRGHINGIPDMRNQGFWLSVHSPGTPKEHGDPFTVKWDQTAGGCNCRPVGGPFQPDHDTQGYNFGLSVLPGTDAYLQIYDAAYQPKPGYNDAQLVGHINPNFDSTHPCGDPLKGPGQCGGGADFNNPSTMWCGINDVETGDNQPGVGSCDSQAANITTIYNLYYPDSTPWYFDDDHLADSWSVPADHLPQPGDIKGGVYSQTWTNFKNVANPGYHIYPYQGNSQWRLQVTNLPDTDQNANGVRGQNNYAIRLKTNYASTQVYAIQRLPVLATVHAGNSQFYLANVPVEDQGKTLVISLFDPGDANGSNYMQLLAPPDTTHPQPWVATFDYYVHDKYLPPGLDQVYIGKTQLDTTRPAHDTNDKWIDVIYKLPLDTVHNGSFEGGYFQIQYVFSGQTEDRTAWRISIRGNPVHIVLGGS